MELPAIELESTLLQLLLFHKGNGTICVLYPVSRPTTRNRCLTHIYPHVLQLFPINPAPSFRTHLPFPSVTPCVQVSPGLCDYCIQVVICTLGFILSVRFNLFLKLDWVTSSCLKYKCLISWTVFCIRPSHESCRACLLAEELYINLTFKPVACTDCFVCYTNGTLYRLKTD